jgi:orotate phosphoribosyltransferase
MSLESITGLKVAEYLLQIEAVKLNPTQPFTWASGLRSPIYCDNRKILSYPAIRKSVAQSFVDIISTYEEQPEIIAGVATGGIGIGAIVADIMNLPFIYVRSEAKKHGMGNQVEGICEAGSKVMVIEDLISTGKSSLAAIDALLEKNANVIGMVAIFSYLFSESKEKFSHYPFAVKTLSQYDFLLEQAVISNYLAPDQMETLKEWKLNPAQWSAQFDKTL